MEQGCPTSGLPFGLAVGLVTIAVILTTSPVALASFGNTGLAVHPALGVLRELQGGAASLPSSSGLSLVGSIPVGSEAIGVVYDSHDANVDVLVGSNNLTIVRASNDSVVESIALPPSYIVYPVAETYDSRDNLVYVTEQTWDICTGCWGPVTIAINGSTGRIFATNTSLGGIDSTHYLTCLGYDPQNGIVYACDSYSPGNLVLYNGTTDTILRSIAVGSYPSSMTFDPTNGDVYVTDRGSNSVTVLDAASNKVVGSIPVGSEPDGITFDSANGFLYVANNASDNVTVINGTSNIVTASIPVGCQPGALTYDSANGRVYVANWCSENLTAISGVTNTVVGAVPVGYYPDAVTYDSLNQRVYVANFWSDNVTVLATTMTYAVTFTEDGLPSGTEWFVNLTGGASHNSTSDAITFSEPNGTYPYAVATIDKECSAVGGSFTVNGTSVSEPLTFSPVTYTVTFRETGLPYLANWYVNGTGFSSETTVGALAGTADSIGLQNGSYTYTVATTAAGYSVNRTTGTFIVNGAPVQVPSFAFTPTSRQATFLGLPATEGYVLFGGIVVGVIVGVLVAALLSRRRKSKTTVASPPVVNPPRTPPGNS